MRLCDTHIEEYLDAGKIVIEPRPLQSSISGVSVDIRLGNEFRVFSEHTTPYIDLSENEAFFLHPGELALAVTYENVTLPDNVVGWLDGRSSLARLGLMVHVTAHRIDPGWSGKIVLEFYNSGKLPLALRPKMTIGALNFELLSAPAARPYNKRADAKYKVQQGAVASRINQDA